jgi:omega-amidase
MKISLIQYGIVWENKIENLRNLETLISPLLNKTDIVVLPEMFNSGFSMNPDRLFELPGGETFIWMQNIAEKGNFGICGSYIVFENNQFYNRFVFVSPEKQVWQYDKRHLFGIAGENIFFTPGKERLIFMFRELRISPYICYDLRFPVWSRNRNEFELIIYTANWPERRRGVWNTLLKARAIENQCFVAGVNRIGTDGNGITYCGESSIVSPFGEIIVTASPSLEGSVTGEISMSDLSQFRKKFPVLKDSDDFTIIV